LDAWRVLMHVSVLTLTLSVTLIYSEANMKFQSEMLNV